MGNESGMYCVKCGAVIPQGGKFCPKCGASATTDDVTVKLEEVKVKKPFYKKWWFWVVAVLFCLWVIGGVLSEFEEDNVESSTKETEETTVAESPTEPSSKYMVVTVSQLVADLDANALNAKEKYKGAYVEITGRVDVIDASGNYIGLYSTDKGWDLTNVHCDIKNKEQKEFVRSISTGDIVTLRGKITSVGEVLGYNLDIHEFVE